MDIFMIMIMIMIIPIVLLSGILLIFLIVSFYEIVILTPKEFIKKKGIIVSVNVIKDNDTGLFSQGSVSQTTLLFKDGEVITIDEKIDSVILNRKCILYFTKTKYFEEEKFSRIVYVKKSRDNKR